MSFVMPSQRGFDHHHQQLSHSESLNQLSIPQNLNSNVEDDPVTTTSKIQMPPSPYSAYTNSPLSTGGVPSYSPTSPHLHSGHQNNAATPHFHSSYESDHPQTQLPKLGEIRCYWSLLSADLRFIYLDPVLAYHLEEQAEALVGKSLLTFVHPDEQASAGRDLGDVLDSRTSHGSVTRVRYSRLSRVRRMLGHQGTGVPWEDAEKIALDSNYMALDVVINWAAEGLVLCFLHAAVDLTPLDNDEHNKTGWTNWCGTPHMSVEQIQLLYQRLLVCAPQTGTMSRVFQILSNDQEKTLMMTWPPDQGQGQGPTGRDFAKSALDVRIGSDAQPGSDAKTSCTRRYKSQQHMPSIFGEVESIFIPHGKVIFACHKQNGPPRGTTAGPSSMQHLGYGSNTYLPYYQQTNAYSLSATPPDYNSNFSQQQAQPNNHSPTQYSPEHWSQAGQQQAEVSAPSQPPFHNWNSPSPTHPTSPSPPSVSNLRSESYPRPPSQNQQHWPGASQLYVDHENPAVSPFPRSHTSNYEFGARERGKGASSPSDVVPPPKRRVSPGDARDQQGGKAPGGRPMGVLKCSSCKATQSPEWRKGPSGKKELCNACGLRYARSRAKKEGANPSQRRRKDKGLASLVKRESPTSPSPPMYSSLRRNYGDQGSYISTSPNGSVSSEVYAGTASRPELDSLTPSPSPPASSMSFVHYAPSPHPHQHGENRQSYSSASGNAFYSVPSPLSNPPMLRTQHDNSPRHSPPSHSPQHYQTQHQHQHSPQTIPRLDHISTYSESHSPTRGSTLGSTGPPASYERERNRDRELPPTPVSASPSRHPLRSILSQQ